jgi:hypothetical protein
MPFFYLIRNFLEVFFFHQYVGSPKVFPVQISLKDAEVGANREKNYVGKENTVEFIFDLE